MQPFTLFAYSDAFAQDIYAHIANGIVRELNLLQLFRWQQQLQYLCHLRIAKSTIVNDQSFDLPPLII